MKSSSLLTNQTKQDANNEPVYATIDKEKQRRDRAARRAANNRSRASYENVITGFLTNKSEADGQRTCSTATKAKDPGDKAYENAHRAVIEVCRKRMLEIDGDENDDGIAISAV